MHKADLIAAIEAEVKYAFENEATGHDWYHIDRVRKNALRIAKAESADLHLVGLAALHDIADHKFHDNDLTLGAITAKEWIVKYGGDELTANRVAEIVSQVSYQGSGVDTPVSSLEAACVQDADRLDAIGAIGIARAFAFGGSRNREIYNPNKPPNLHDSFMAYAKDEGTTVNHFYEKLLLLKDRMQTEKGKRMAQERHAFMKGFLQEFYREWDCEF